jgi:hypothetical protein
MSKLRVYIVFKEPSGWDYSPSEFVGVFFDQQSARKWIGERKHPHKYSIEIYEKSEDGMAKEVFEEVEK